MTNNDPQHTLETLTRLPSLRYSARANWLGSEREVMIIVRKEFCDGSILAAHNYAGPVRFTCNGAPETLTAHHSIWEPMPVFEFNMPWNGRIVIESEEN